MKRVALFLTFAAAASAQMSQPILGYVPDGPRIRVMRGIPAAGAVGEFLDTGRELAQVVVSPKQDYILATAADTGEVLLIRPGYAATSLAGTTANPLAMLLSPSGRAAALFFNEQGRVQIITGLPAAPSVREIPFEPSSWMAVSDSGELAGDSAPFAFLHGSSAIVQPKVEWGVIFDVGVTADNRLAVAATASGKLHVIDLRDDTTSTVDCECSLNGLASIGASLFRLRLLGMSRGVKIFDASTKQIYDVPRELSAAIVRHPGFMRWATPQAAAPLPAVTIGGLPTTTGPGQQPAMTISLASAYSADVTGTATLTFASSVGGDDQTIQFGSGGRTVNFTIAAGSTTASFSGKSNVTVLTGTVAGTITVKLSLSSGGADITPTPAPQATITTTANVPFIQTVQLQQTTGGFNVLVTGFASAREVTSGTFHFAPSSNATLAMPDVVVQLGQAFAQWYSNSASNALGSEFLLTVPFTTQNGPPVDIIAVTVTLTNSKGNSNPVVNQ